MKRTAFFVLTTSLLTTTASATEHKSFSGASLGIIGGYVISTTKTNNDSNLSGTGGVHSYSAKANMVAPGPSGGLIFSYVTQCATLSGYDVIEQE